MTTPERSPCGTMCVFGSIRSRKPKSSSRATICLRAAKPVERRAIPRQAAARSFRQAAQIILVADKRERALLIEHADLRQVVPPPDLEIVEVMRRRDLHRARALFGIGIFVGDDRNLPPDQRQDDVLADQMRVALVVRMHRDGGVAEHRLRPRGGDDDVGRGIVRIEGLAFQRIAQIPQAALDLDLLHLEIGDRGQQFRDPSSPAACPCRSALRDAVRRTP